MQVGAIENDHGAEPVNGGPTPLSKRSSPCPIHHMHPMPSVHPVHPPTHPPTNLPCSISKPFDLLRGFDHCGYLGRDICHCK